MRPESLGRLADILDAARFIADDTASTTYDEFLSDRRMRQAVLYNFLVIGEAVNWLRRHDQEIADQITAVEQIVGLRNTLIHGYQAIDYPTVWRTIQKSLPVLQTDVAQCLGETDVA